MGDGLAACFERRDDIVLVAVVADLAAVREVLLSASVDLLLIDVSHGIDLYDVRSLAAEHPGVALVALGLNEQRQNVIRCGHAGFSGYVCRDASVEALCKALSDVMAGRLACSAEISGGLLRALFRMESPQAETPESALTRRESDVLKLIGRGLSNKEIARELVLSVATVKHHVHNILDKLNLPRRAQAMRRVRDAPWLVGTSDDEASWKENRK
jgi:DNA-binding NarL/FixJ family response regulator